MCLIFVKNCPFWARLINVAENCNEKETENCNEKLMWLKIAMKIFMSPPN